MDQARWAEANRRLGAEKPDVEKEIARVEAAKVRASVERYFEAFEAGTLKAELCNRKVQDLHDRLERLESEKAELAARREHLKLPVIDREMLSALVDNFEQVIAEGAQCAEEGPPSPVGEEGPGSRPPNHRGLVRVTERSPVRTL